ncbi:MAG: hypothetical protein ACI845_001649 [Gammaproteobacteria bacterium]
MKRICVYCGSSPGNLPEYLDAAQGLGLAMLERKIGLVYGGGTTGLMGQIADTVADQSGETIGVIPHSLVNKEFAHTGLTELIKVENMHLRKERMASLADGFIALPGGFGTLEELFEIITWAQLEFHNKPIGILNVCGYYDHLANFITHALESRFIKSRHRSLFIINSEPGALIDEMLQRDATNQS